MLVVDLGLGWGLGSGRLEGLFVLSQVVRILQAGLPVGTGSWVEIQLREVGTAYRVGGLEAAVHLEGREEGRAFLYHREEEFEDRLRLDWSCRRVEEVGLGVSERGFDL